MAMFTDDEIYQLQTNEANYIDLNAGLWLKSLCIPPVNTVSNGGQIKNLWKKKRGLELSVDPLLRE